VSEVYNAIAAGEELVDHLASVMIWYVISKTDDREAILTWSRDFRNSTVSRHYTESHNDDVTEVLLTSQLFEAHAQLTMRKASIRQSEFVITTLRLN